MNYNETLRAAIEAAVKTPADPRISGAILQQQMMSIMGAVDAGAVFLGTATPATIPTTEANCFFLATTPGTYTHFLDTGDNPIVIAQGEAALIRSVIYLDNLRWQKATLFTGGGSAQLAVSITYAALKALRDGGNLVPGTWYRITDYVCTTTQDNTQSANHAFDIIVRADDASHLNENGYAAHHTGDTYFATCKLEAWELKYSLDNDTNRFAWADEENGKGVIFYMKDEWGNIAPFDFKNMLFTRDSEWFGDHETWAGDVLGEVPETDLHFYFLSWVTEDGEVQDASIVCQTLTNDEGAYTGVYDNEIKETTAYDMGITEDATSTAFALPCTIIVSSYAYEDGVFYGCYGNKFGNNCYNNTFGNDCGGNTFGSDCSYNSFGNGCSGNTFGNYCSYNSFGNGCGDNSFGNSCGGNTFGNECFNNSFGNNCYDNTFGNGCSGNTFGNGCGNNSFGNGFQNNTFGNDCDRNSFGNYCNSNSFGNYCQNNTLGNYCQTITVFDGVQNCSVTGGSQSAPVKNAQILNGTAGALAQNKLTIAFAANKAYTQVAAKTTAGNLQIFNPADLVQ